jgi:hypothetical protein
METSSAPNNQCEDLSFDQSGLGKSSGDDCMVLEGLKHLIVFLPEHLASIKKLLQDTECKSKVLHQNNMK